LRSLIDRDAEHRALYRVFLAVRDAAAKILESTSLADIANPSSLSKQKSRKKKSDPGSVALISHPNTQKGVQ